MHGFFGGVGLEEGKLALLIAITNSYSFFIPEILLTGPASESFMATRAHIEWKQNDLCVIIQTKAVM